MIHGEITKMDTTLLVATLLTVVLESPQVVPRAFYTPYHQELPEDIGPDDENLTDIYNENARTGKAH